MARIGSRIAPDISLSMRTSETASVPRCASHGVQHSVLHRFIAKPVRQRGRQDSTMHITPFAPDLAGAALGSDNRF